MTFRLLLVASLVFFLLGCKNQTKKKEAENINTDQVSDGSGSKEDVESDVSQDLTVIYDESKDHLKAYYDLPLINEFYSWNDMTYKEPPPLKYPEDLSTLSYEELRLLRNEVFARNGYLFKDGYLRGYFNQFDWYMPIFDVDTFKVVLNKQERDLINAVLQEEKIRKENQTVSLDGLRLFNVDLVTNQKQFRQIPEKVIKDLGSQNFSIVETSNSMPFFVYDRNAYEYVPHYITTDLYLYILHKYFSVFLEELEEKQLARQLKELLVSTSVALENLDYPQLREPVEWAQVYTTIALYALGDTIANVPSRYVDVFEKEMHAIKECYGNPAFIKNDYVDYRELYPRAHYTKSKTLSNYFRGFKWMSLNGIDINNDMELRGMVTFAFVVKNNPQLLKIYEEYVTSIEKLAGQEDNLSFADIIETLEDGSLEQVLEHKSINDLRQNLANLEKEKIRTVFGESYQTDERGKKRFYFLSSTYSVSGDIFSNLVHVDLQNSKRPFPRALDVPAVFGNPTAQHIISEEYRDAYEWPDFTSRLESLQDRFSEFYGWDSNYSMKGLQTALAALAESPYYPDFMKTDAYNRKELSTMLSSWTHIKHDMVLYHEKPVAAQAGQGGGPEPPQYYCYVEPNLEFWNAALELLDWLDDLKLYESKFDYQLSRIKELGLLLRKTTEKQLSNEPITDEEFSSLHYVGGIIEHILLGLMETDHLPDREKSMALIADVYSYNGMNLNVAVGNADDIYVLVPINGEYYISRGSVFSFYEFKGKIYTDELWQLKVKNKTTPDRPEWIQSIIHTDVVPLDGVLQFRY